MSGVVLRRDEVQVTDDADLVIYDQEIHDLGASHTATQNNLCDCALCTVCGVDRLYGVR